MANPENVASFEAGLREFMNSAMYANVPDRDRGIAFNYFKDTFIKGNPGAFDNEDYEVINAIGESLTTEFKNKASIPRLIPTKDEIQLYYGGLPDLSGAKNADEKVKKIDEWKGAALERASKLRPADKGDFDTHLSYLSNNLIRDTVAEENQTGWLGDKTYRLAEGFAGMVSPFIEGSDRFFAENLPEDPTRNDDISSMLAAGLGEVTSQAIIGLGTSAIAGPEVGVAAIGSIYAARSLQEGYKEEMRKSGDSAKALDVGLAGVSGSLLETFAAKIFFGMGKEGVTFAKRFLDATTDEAKRQVVKEALPSLGSKVIKNGLTEAGIGSIGADFTTGMGRYLASGDESYIPSAESLAKGALVEGILGAGLTPIFSPTSSDRAIVGKELQEFSGNKAKASKILEALKSKNYDEAVDLATAIYPEKAVEVEASKTDKPKQDVVVIDPATGKPYNNDASKNISLSTIGSGNLAYLQQEQREAVKANDLESAKRIEESINAIKGGTFVDPEEFGVDSQKLTKNGFEPTTDPIGSDSGFIVSLDNKEVFEQKGNIIYVKGLTKKAAITNSISKGGTGIIIIDGDASLVSGRNLDKGSTRLEFSQVPKKEFSAISAKEVYQNPKGQTVITKFSVLGSVQEFAKSEKAKAATKAVLSKNIKKEAVDRDVQEDNEALDAASLVIDTIQQNESFSDAGYQSVEQAAFTAFEKLDEYLANNPDNKDTVEEFQAELFKALDEAKTKIKPVESVKPVRENVDLFRERINQTENLEQGELDVPVQVKDLSGKTVNFNGQTGTLSVQNGMAYIDDVEVSGSEALIQDVEGLSEYEAPASKNTEFTLGPDQDGKMYRAERQGRKFFRVYPDGARVRVVRRQQEIKKEESKQEESLEPTVENITTDKSNIVGPLYKISESGGRAVTTKETLEEASAIADNLEDGDIIESEGSFFKVSKRPNRSPFIELVDENENPLGEVLSLANEEHVNVNGTVVKKREHSKKALNVIERGRVLSNSKSKNVKSINLSDVIKNPDAIFETVNDEGVIEESTVDNDAFDDKIEIYQNGVKIASKPGVPGYRITDEKSSKNYQENGGWKIHLAVDKSNYAAVDKWLFNNHKGQYKLITGGDIGESDFTIYIGDKDTMSNLAEKIQQEIGDLIIDKNDSNSSSDAIINPKVSARFDIQHTKKGKKLGFTNYGMNGIPFGSFDSGFGAILTPNGTRQQFIDNNRKNAELIDNILKKEYGEYYTGSKSVAKKATKSKTDEVVKETPPAVSNIIITPENLQSRLQHLQEEKVKPFESRLNKGHTNEELDRLIAEIEAQSNVIEQTGASNLVEAIEASKSPEVSEEVKSLAKELIYKPEDTKKEEESSDKFISDKVEEKISSLESPVAKETWTTNKDLIKRYFKATLDAKGANVREGEFLKLKPIILDWVDTTVAELDPKAKERIEKDRNEPIDETQDFLDQPDNKNSEYTESEKDVAEAAEEVLETLEDSEKEEIASELSILNNPISLSNGLKVAYADFLVNAKEFSKKLQFILGRISSILKSRIMSIGVAISILPGVIGSPSVINSNFYNVSEIQSYGTNFREVEKQKLSVDFGSLNDMQLATESSVSSKVSIPSGINTKLKIDKETNFKNVSYSDNVKDASDWILNYSNNEGKPYVIADKVNGLIYIFDKNGNIIKRTYAIFGKDSGDVLSDGKSITPTGIYNASVDNNVTEPFYKGTTVDFLDKGESVLAIHRVYLAKPSEKRMERLNSKDPSDNRISHGCINVTDDVYDKIIYPQFNKADGGMVYILPETKRGNKVIERQKVDKTKTRYSLGSSGGNPGISFSEAQDYIDKNGLNVRIENTNKVTSSGSPWRGMTHFVDGFAPVVYVNIANIRDIAQLRNVINEELGHIAYADEGIRKTISKIIDTTKLQKDLDGLYAEEDIFEESVTKRMADLVDSYSEKGLFDKLITAIRSYVKDKLGMELSDADLSYIAYRAIVKANKVTKSQESGQKLSADNSFNNMAEAGGGFFFGMSEVRDNKIIRTGKSDVTIRKDGTLSLHEFKQAGGQLGVLQDGEIELYKQLVPEAFEGDRVNVNTLWNGLKKAGDSIRVVTYGQDGQVSKAKKELDKLTHDWYDNLSYSQKLAVESANLNFDLDSEFSDRDLDRLNTQNVNLSQAKKYAELTNKVKAESKDATLRATSNYDTISPFDTRQYPVMRIDVVLPSKLTPEERVEFDSLGAAGKFTSNRYKELESKANKDIIWQQDNLHENLPNTLGWAMVQIVPDPKTGESVMFVAEQQSRWGQTYRDHEKYAKNNLREDNTDDELYYYVSGNGGGKRAKTKEEAIKNYVNERSLNHPLLPIQANLILKSVIQEAQKQGISKVAISDAETAMMTERHDVPSSNFNVIIRPSQEGGMRLHYDTTLPSIMKKLVGNNGVKEDFGAHKNSFEKANTAELQPYYVFFRLDNQLIAGFETEKEAKNYINQYSENPRRSGDLAIRSNFYIEKNNSAKDRYQRNDLVFKNPDGTPKTNVTATVYDISSPSSRVRTMFSLASNNTQESEELFKPVDDIFSIITGQISEEKKRTIRNVHRAIRKKLEKDLIVDEPEAWSTLKAVKHTFLNESQLKEFNALLDEFVRTRSKSKDPKNSTPRISASSVIAQASELVKASNQGHFDFLQLQYDFLEGKDFFDAPFNGDIDLVLQQVKDNRGANDSDLPNDKDDESMQMWQLRVLDLQDTIFDNEDYVKDRMEEMFPDASNITKTGNEIVDRYTNQGYTESVNQIMDSFKRLFKQRINQLMEDPTSKNFRDLRQQYYGLMDFLSDGYALNIQDFVTPETAAILETELQDGDFLQVGKTKWGKKAFQGTASTYANLNAHGSKVADLAHRLSSKFRGGILAAERIHEEFTKPALKELMQKAIAENGGNKFTNEQLNFAGIYAMSRAFKASEGVTEGILASKASIERSLAKDKNSIWPNNKRNSQLRSNFISDLFVGIDKDTPNDKALDILEANAEKLLPPGMTGYVKGVASLFEVTKPLAKFSAEFGLGRQFEEWVNYIPSLAVSKDGTPVKEDLFTMQTTSDDAGLSDINQDTNMSRGGMGSTKERTRQLGDNMVYVFNINHLAENRMRLNLIDYLTLPQRRELNNVISGKGTKYKQFAEMLKDTDGSQERVSHIQRTLRTAWSNSVQSAHFISEFQGLVNTISNMWASGKLASLYQFAQLPSNLIPYFIAHTGNPKRIKYLFDAFGIILKKRFGQPLDPRLDKTVTRVLKLVEARSQEQFLDKGIALDVNSSDLWQKIKDSKLFSGLEKLNGVREKILFTPFRFSDYYSGAPMMLANIMYYEEQAGRAAPLENSPDKWSGLTYNDETFIKSLDEAERFIGIGASSRRGVWTNNKNGWLVVIRNLLTAFSSHRINNATNAAVEMAKLRDSNITNEEKIQSIRYIVGIAAQSAIFTVIKWAMVGGFYNLLSAKMGEEENEDELELYYKKLLSGNYRKGDKKLIEAEIALRENVRNEFKNTKERNTSKEVVLLRGLQDIISNTFVIPAITDIPLNAFIHATYDKHEAEAFKAVKEAELEQLGEKLKKAKASKNISMAIELQKEISRWESQEAIPLVFEQRGTVPSNGLYGGTFSDAEKFLSSVAGAALTAESITMDDVMMGAGLIGITQPDINRIVRMYSKMAEHEKDYVEKIQKLQDEKKKKTRE